MKNSFKLFLSFVFIILIITYSTCNKDDVPPDNDHQPLVFYSLEATKDTILGGVDTTLITATASGYELKYYWSATAGDIIGSGYQVSYFSTPCGSGGNQITCTVKDGYGASESKSITIIVL